MTPDVVVDIGNSRMKWGRVSDGRIAEAVAFEHDDAVAWKRQGELWQVSELTQWAVVSVVPKAYQRFTAWLAGRAMGWFTITNDQFTSDIFDIESELDDDLIGFMTGVDEPDLIGTDRLLTAFAAWKRTPLGYSAVAINVGTAMTIDFVEAAGLHRGGAILPGPRLMAKSLHEHTAKLPLVEIDPDVPILYWGSNTESAIELGIANAVLGVADQMVWDWAVQRERPPWVHVTGGDAGYFDGFVFTADVGRLVLDPTLTLDGIRLAAEAQP